MSWIKDLAEGGLTGLFEGFGKGAEGIGNAARSLRAAITGKEIIPADIEVKLQEIENEAIKIQQQLPLAVNLTMQAEAKSEHWAQYTWRPFWGFASAVAFVGVCAFCLFLGYQAVIVGKPEAMQMIPQVITSFVPLFAIPGAILGVASWHRGKQKRGI